MRTSSCKAKGRRLSQGVRDALLQIFPELEPDDVTVTPSGVTGPDLLVSPHAKRILGFYAECKNQESISIWDCVSQANSYTQGDTQGVLFFARNRTPTHVAMPLPFFLKLIRDSYDYRKTKANQQSDHVRSVQQSAMEAHDPKPLQASVEGRSSDSGVNTVGVSERGGEEP